MGFQLLHRFEGREHAEPLELDSIFTGGVALSKPL